MEIVNERADQAAESKHGAEREEYDGEAVNHAVSVKIVSAI